MRLSTSSGDYQGYKDFKQDQANSPILAQQIMLLKSVDEVSSTTSSTSQQARSFVTVGYFTPSGYVQIDCMESHTERLRMQGVLEQAIPTMLQSRA